MASAIDRELEILGLSEHSISPQPTRSFPGASRDGSKASSQQRLHSHNGSHDSNMKAMFRDRERSEDISEDDKQAVKDYKSEYTEFTESTVVPRRHLGYFQTTSLMLNGAFGSFFFSTPYLTLALVRSKRICLVLWALGGVYSALGMTLILEYGTALPFTGGALIYLDKVFHKPTLFATVVFSFWWVLFETTENVCKGIAQTILSLATGQSALSLDVRLINFTAIVVQTLACLMLFFARRATFTFNTIFSMYRIVLMVFLFVAGMVASRRPNSGLVDFNVEYPGYNGKDALSAMIYIILCYQGYENANYVTGEIKDVKRTLLRSGITTISLLAVLNVLVTFAFFSVADFATLTTPDGQASSVYLFASIVFKSRTGMEIAVLLTSFSGLLFTTYTAARVKQAAAWQRIVPFSRLFGRQDPYYDSPAGGLFLHWIVTVIAILGTGNSASDSRQFFSGIYGYGYQLLWVFLALGLFRLTSAMRKDDSSWNPTYLKNKVVLAFVAIVFMIMNIVTLVMNALPENPGQVPRFYWPIASVVITAAAILYWAIIRLFQVKGDKGNRLGKAVGFQVHIYEEGDEVPDDMKFCMYEASLDGSNRRVVYEASGLLGRYASRLHRFKNAVIRFFASKADGSICPPFHICLEDSIYWRRSSENFGTWTWRKLCAMNYIQHTISRP